MFLLDNQNEFVGKVNFIMCHILFLYYSIIATPGRFMHVVVEMDLKLKSVQYVVFDEADR